MIYYSRFKVVLSSLMMLMLACSALVAAGCSDGEDSPTAANLIQPRDESSAVGVLGRFLIELDEAAWELRIIPDGGRTGEWDVTGYAEISIVNMQWDPAKRNWTLTCSLKNPTALTGHGVWAVFTELGAKEIVGTDGFIYTPPPENKRVPLVAFRKGPFGRPFPPLYQDVRDIVIHWPEGVDKWVPIQFYIDAAWPNTRKMPVVENLGINEEPGYNFLKAVVAYVEDWQDPGDTLTVWADLTSIGGGLPTMFDDGEHKDGNPNDHVFGGYFLDQAVAPGTYTFTVYAEDPGGHKFENDTSEYFTGGAVPDDCFEITVLAEGIHCQYNKFDQKTIDDQTAFEDHWKANFGDLTGIPTVDFETERVVAINLGMFSSSGHNIIVDRIPIDRWVDCLCINVDYIRAHAGMDCITLPVGTSPYWIGKFEKTIHSMHFFGMDYIFDCPDSEDSLNSWLIARGKDSQIVGFNEYFIEDQDSWAGFWSELTASSETPPPVDFTQYAVVAVVMGVQERGMYFPDLRRVLYDTSGAQPVYKARYAYVYPSDNCYSTYIPTVPYGVWRIQKPDHPLVFDKYSIEMTCN